jgi:hypothetical protein
MAVGPGLGVSIDSPVHHRVRVLNGNASSGETALIKMSVAGSAIRPPVVAPLSNGVATPPTDESGAIHVMLRPPRSPTDVFKNPPSFGLGPPRITFSHDRCVCGHMANVHTDSHGGSGGACDASSCGCRRFTHAKTSEADIPTADPWGSSARREIAPLSPLAGGGSVEPAPLSTVPRDHCNRCDRCGWPMSAKLGGCRPGDCSQRPGVPLRDTCAGCGALFESTPRKARLDPDGTAKPLTILSAPVVGHMTQGAGPATHHLDLATGVRTPLQGSDVAPAVGEGHCGDTQRGCWRPGHTACVCRCVRCG